jgi:tyrosyl-tRNA synthetase
MTFVEELRWRGLLHDMIPGTEELLVKEKVTAYIGFDPTAESLHIGSLIPIILLMHLQRHGHKPIALVGGATGMIGDPSFKAEERKMLTEEALRRNVAGIEKQLHRFLYFEKGAELVNNYDWFKDFSLLGFLRDVGKHISVNYMMAKDSVKKRLETGISFTEFSYQLIQGYDFYWLWKNKGVMLQMGGSDQWGNIVTGTELIRRMAGGEAYALTVPLVTKADGSKFGKTEQGNVWLDAALTSPYQFYQFWLNASDEDAARYIKMFTFLEQETIETLLAEHAVNPAQRILQKKLAEEVTCLVHGRAEYETALAATSVLFGQGTKEQLSAMPLQTFLQVFDGVPQFDVPMNLLEAGIPVLDLLAVNSAVFESKGEARKMIQQNALSINKEKYADVNGTLGTEHLIGGKYLLVQKGKKNYYLLHFTA